MTKNLGLGASKELVYHSRLSIKEPSAGSKEAQTRDIRCVVNELATGVYSVPIDLRLNEVEPATLTPRLQLFKKDLEKQLPEPNPVVSGTEINLGTQVSLILLCLICCVDIRRDLKRTSHVFFSVRQ